MNSVAYAIKGKVANTRSKVLKLQLYASAADFHWLHTMTCDYKKNEANPKKAI